LIWLPALYVALFGTLVLVRVIKTGRVLGLLLASLKVLMPLVYFARFYQNRWNLLDDLTYFEQGRLLLLRGNSPFLILFTPDGRERLFAIAGGHHVLYYWWNLLAVYLFRPFYSSPVLLNVATTFVSAALLFKFARLSDLSESYARWLAIFLLFQWDVLAWSSFVNLKDVLLLLMILGAAFMGAKLQRERGLLAGIGLAAILLLFYWIRFYDTVLFLGSYGAWLALAVKGPKKLLWLSLAAAAALVAIPAGGYELFRTHATHEWIYGPFKMAMTPRPWNIAREYSFLLVPSILHWCFILPGLIAGALLWRRNEVFRLAAILGLVFLTFYGLVPELLGPRQRLQVAWVFAWLQFHTIWLIARGVVERLSPAIRFFGEDRRGIVVGPNRV